MEKYIELFEKAKNHFKIADHLLYVTLIILKDNKLIMKALTELANSADNYIKSVIFYENSLKRMKICANPEINMKNFIEIVSKRYLSRQELESLLEIREIEKKRRQAPMEFMKREKFVFVNGREYGIVTMEKIKEFLAIMRSILIKTSRQLPL